MEEPKFPAGSVPVNVAARVYKKDPSWVRSGLIFGWLPIGLATRNGIIVHEIGKPGHARTNYYISPRKLWLETGFVWKGEKT